MQVCSDAEQSTNARFFDMVYLFNYDETTTA